VGVRLGALDQRALTQTNCLVILIGVVFAMRAIWALDLHPQKCCVLRKGLQRGDAMRDQPSRAMERIHHLHNTSLPPPSCLSATTASLTPNRRYTFTWTLAGGWDLDQAGL
jgi:hypothetical protein